MIKEEMTTFEIDSILRRCPATATTYTSIFPVDLLPQYRLEERKKPAVVIINLGASDTAGTHWTLLFLPRAAPSFYFDSLGEDVRAYPALRAFVERNSRMGYICNRIKLQDDASKSCGLFVIVVACLLSRGIHHSQISSYFSSSPRANEAILRRMIKQILT
jgi:hypothetical protein